MTTFVERYSETYKVAVQVKFKFYRLKLQISLPRWPHKFGKFLETENSTLFEFLVSIFIYFNLMVVFKL